MPEIWRSAAGAGRVAVPREDLAIGVFSITSTVSTGMPLRLTGPRAVKRKLLYSSTYILRMQVSWEVRRLPRFLGYRLHTMLGSCRLTRRPA